MALPATVAKDATIYVDKTKSDTNADSTSDPGYIDLSDGKGTWSVTITAEDGTATNTYTVNFAVQPAAPEVSAAVIGYENETISFTDAYEMNTAEDFDGTEITTGGETENSVSDLKDITETLNKLIDPESPTETDKAAVDAVADEVTKLPDAAKQALTADDVKALDELKTDVGKNIPSGNRLNITIDKNAEGQAPAPEHITAVGAAIVCGVDSGNVVVSVKPVQPSGSGTKLELKMELIVNNNKTALAAPMFFQMEVPAGIDPNKLTLYHVKDDGSRTELRFAIVGVRTISFKMLSFSSVQFVIPTGVGSTTFSPDLSTTRGMIVAILWRLEQEPESGATMTFGDVKAGSYCFDAVRWAAEHEIVKGYTATTFGPDHSITRQELAAILYRYAQYTGADVSVSDDLAAFTDRPDAWVEDAVEWAVGEGILSGKGGGILDPKGQATRAQAAAMLMRFLSHTAN